MKYESQARLDQLAQEILTRDVCPELRAQASQLVMGSGNPNASIVFIGEAPGKQEDLEGKPFVGASGKLLNTMLAKIGLERSDVYITNIVKYRPPNNRDPKPEEKSEFLPYLVEQIKIINPEIILTLGQHSLSQFIADVKIGEVHGQPHQVMFGGRERTLVPLFHPAYALYNGGNKQLLMDDFLKLPELLKATA